MNQTTLDKRLQDEIARDVARFTKINERKYGGNWTEFLTVLQEKRAENTAAQKYDAVAKIKNAINIAEIGYERKQQSEQFAARAREIVKPYTEARDTLFDGNWRNMLNYMVDAQRKDRSYADNGRMIGFINLACNEQETLVKSKK